MNLKIMEAPTAEPVTLTEAKEHLRITHSNEDSFITKLVKVARQRSETLTKLALASATFKYTIDKFPADEVITLPMPPLEEVSSVKYLDTDGVEYTLDSGDYIVYDDVPAKIIPAYNQNFPDIELYPIGAVRITYKAGYREFEEEDEIQSLIIPEEIKQAMLLIIADYYEHREDLLASGHIPKVIPFGAEALLTSYKNWSF